ncbi:MAG: YgiT-type zinc finger protein [Bdellovibrio sp.]|nr:YgiT-type zinc finger protein [Bdellovibrio sp.]
MEKYFDVCDRCQSRELDFVFCDLKHEGRDLWIKDIPAFRCRECGEVLVSMGVIETVDEVISKISKSCVFPILQYQRQVLKVGGLERNLNERYLHSWDMIRPDGRDLWAVEGFRSFGDTKTLSAI